MSRTTIITILTVIAAISFGMLGLAIIDKRENFALFFGFTSLMLLGILLMVVGDEEPPKKKPAPAKPKTKTEINIDKAFQKQHEKTNKKQVQQTKKNVFKVVKGGKK